jgi:hypothetical protein
MAQRDTGRGAEPLSYIELVAVRVLAGITPLLLTCCISEGDVLSRQNSAVPDPDPQARPPLLFVDFESSPVGSYADAAVVADFGNLPWADDGFTEIVQDARGRALRVHYPAGSVGTTDGGAVWRAALGGVHDDVTVSFKLRFGPGFDFVRGGILPGLGGGEANSNQNVPNGTDGWTARASWVEGGAMQHVVYYPDQSAPYGDNLAWPDVTLVSDRWYELTQRVVMNTPGAADGKMQVWLDGASVLDWSGVRWRDVSSLGIDVLLFSAFFGGSGDEFRAAKDEYTDFDDFRVVAGAGE